MEHNVSGIVEREMKKTILNKSKCCNAEVRLNRATIKYKIHTMYYICTKCDHPCDVKGVKMIKD